MNFSEQSFDDDLNIISSYENDSICIKKKKYYGNLLIPAKGLIKEINKNFKDDLSSSLDKINVNKFDLFIIGYNKNPNDLDWLTGKIKKLGICKVSYKLYELSFNPLICLGKFFTNLSTIFGLNL